MTTQVAARIAVADGAPCPTLVLDRHRLPREEPALRAELARIRRWLLRTGRGHVMKFALCSASDRPGYDLEYRFVQCLPGRAPHFDHRSRCGHSLLAGVVATLPGTTRSRRVRDGAADVHCEPGPGGSWSLRYARLPSPPLTRLLPTGSGTDRLRTPEGDHEVSLVDFGNPYAFVAAESLGLGSARELYGAGAESLGRLRSLRAAAARALRCPEDGALPKIAAVGAWEPGHLTVRSVTGTGWHPTLAVTGAVCLAAAVAAGDVAGSTVPGRLAARTGCGPVALRLRTARDTVTVSAVTGRSPAGETCLRAVGVGPKRARVLEEITEPLWRTRASA